MSCGRAYRRARRRRAHVGRHGMPRGRAMRKLPAFDAAFEHVGAADEIEHVRRRRRAVDLVGRADLLDAAVAQHHDAVGQLQRLFLVVGDEQRGLPGLLVQAGATSGAVRRGPWHRARRTVRRAAARSDRSPARAPARRAASGRRTAVRDSGRRNSGNWISVSSSSTRRAIVALSGRRARGRLRRPKAMFSATVMCLNSA